MGDPSAQLASTDDHILWSVYRPDINRMVTLGRQNAELRVWQLDSSDKPLHELKVPLQGTVDGGSLHLSHDGQLLAAWDHARLVVWDLTDTPPRMYESPLPKGAASGLAFSSNGRLAVIADLDGVSLFDWTNGREVRRLRYGPTSGIAIHPDGRHIAVTNRNCTTYFLRIPELAANAESRPVSAE